MNIDSGLTTSYQSAITANFYTYVSNDAGAESFGSSINLNGGMSPGILAALKVGPTNLRLVSFNLNPIQWTHILARHSWFEWPDASYFDDDHNSPAAIYQLMFVTLTQTVGDLQANGRISFQADMGTNIGMTQPNALGFRSPTSWMTVIVTPTGPNTGDIWTAYPGR